MKTMSDLNSITVNVMIKNAEKAIHQRWKTFKPYEGDRLAIFTSTCSSFIAFFLLKEKLDLEEYLDTDKFILYLNGSLKDETKDYFEFDVMTEFFRCLCNEEKSADGRVRRASCDRILSKSSFLSHVSD